MKLHKRIFEQAWAQSLVSLLIAAYVRFAHATSRWDIRGWDNIQNQIDAGQPVILCFWHARMILSMYGWRHPYKLNMLSTPHRDGKIAALSYNRLGINTIWGSTKKGGTEAARAMIKALKSGETVAITPDGPKGPRQRMQSSAIDIARMSGAKLVPVTAASTNGKILGTWDRLQIPKPFGRGVVWIDAPIEVPRKASEDDFEALRQSVEDRLNTMTRELDREFGFETPEPAELPIPSHMLTRKDEERMP
ncbi:lysophospholipid acyltransferase family protein [Magnetovibrio sp.]|uniref:lysophospholipid acyltransferase family protein n=1 Tax=Magnetovibrio sp. TaxID=2024836 RepID=UPI002F92E00E